MTNKHELWSSIEAVQDLTCASQCKWCCIACPVMGILFAVGLCMFFSPCLSFQRGSAVPLLCQIYALSGAYQKCPHCLSESVILSLVFLTWEKLVLGILFLMPFSSYPLSLVKGQNDVHLFLGQFMRGVSGLVGLSRLNRWNYFVDNQMLMPLTTSLFVFSVSRRACEVWLHSRVCHTWTSLWCTKGKLYKVQSPGLCLPLGYGFSGVFSVIACSNIDHQAISEPRCLCFSFCGFFLLISLLRERCLLCLHSL